MTSARSCGRCTSRPTRSSVSPSGTPNCARALAAEEPRAERRAELERIAEVCSRVPAHAPRDFHEALQAYWFVHLGVITELNTWDAFNPGHLDQHLYPFYRADLAAGTADAGRARELLECFWVKFNNQPAPPKVGVTAAESGTYTDFANINIGGLHAPRAPTASNELSYLHAGRHRRDAPAPAVVEHPGEPQEPGRFIDRACEIVRKGWGQPSMFNADAVVDELLRQGKSLGDARGGRHERLRRNRARSARRRTSSRATSTCRRCWSSP